MSWLGGAGVLSVWSAKGNALGREAQGHVGKPRSLEQLPAGKLMLLNDQGFLFLFLLKTGFSLRESCSSGTCCVQITAEYPHTRLSPRFA